MSLHCHGTWNILGPLQTISKVYYATKMHPKFSQNSVKLQSKYSQNVAKMQPRCSQNTAKMHPKCKQVLATNIAKIKCLFYISEVVIMDENGQRCGQNEVGEIWVKGPGAMKGYLNRPEENSNFFGPDNYYKTGDYASYNSNGNLKYEGRLKELIKYKNCHLYPLEIENVICKHPKVYEAGVFGKPEPTVQELVTAAVVKKPGVELSEQEILDFVNAQVDEAKQIRGGVIFLDQLPKNAGGKLQRKKLLELAS